MNMLFMYVCTIHIIIVCADMTMQQALRLRPDNVAPAAGAALGPAGEEGGCDGGAAEVVVQCKVAGAEVVAEERRPVDSAACHLLEEHQHHPVDPR
jgi:hypothetical protein